MIKTAAGEFFFLRFAGGAKGDKPPCLPPLENGRAEETDGWG